MAIRKAIFVDANGDYEETTGVYETSDYINTSTGVADAGKPIVLDSEGKIDPTMISFNSLSYKTPSRVATVAAIDLASAPAAIDGVTLASGDRVLVKDGSTVNGGVSSIDNGVYVFNGTGSAMTRSLDFDEDDEVVAGSVVPVEEGTANADRVYLMISDNPLVVGTDPLEFGILPFNTFSGGDGINIDGSNVISVDLLDTGSGLEFAGGGTDELAIDFAATFTIDAADDLAPKASDYASSTVGEGAARVGISDASAYYAGNQVEAALDELEAQLGGLTSSTYAFTEQNVLADNDSVYPALDKLDLKWGDLASTANGEGASLVGLEDAGSNYDATNVEDALAEIATKLIDRDCATAGAAITVGDLLYFTADDTVSPMPISSGNRAVGIALETKGIGLEVCYARYDEVSFGAITGLGATFGDRLYWDGSALTTSIPSGSGQYVWQVGVAKNANDMLATVEFIKKNS
jgi:hypothetical protein